MLAQNQKRTKFDLDKCFQWVCWSRNCPQSMSSLKIWPFQSTERLLWFSTTDGVCSVVMETYEHLLPCDLSSILGHVTAIEPSPFAINETLSAEEGEHFLFISADLFSRSLSLRVVAKCCLLVSSSIYRVPALHYITMIDQIWVWNLGQNFPILLFWKLQYWISECVVQMSGSQLTAARLMRPTTHWTCSAVEKCFYTWVPVLLVQCMDRFGVN